MPGDSDTPLTGDICEDALVPVILRKRADFVSASRARRVSRPAFVLQARHRSPEEGVSGVRIGYTCSKKVGNAVARNRAKRRLREAARAILPVNAVRGWDYVLIGRRHSTASRKFALLCDDLLHAIESVHADKKRR